MHRKTLGTCSLTLLMAALGAVGCHTTSSGNVSTETSHSRPATEAMAFPTGEKSSSVLLLERQSPKTIRAGQAFETELKVTNISDQPLANVVVYTETAGNVEMRNTSTQLVAVDAATVESRRCVGCDDGPSAASYSGKSPMMSTNNSSSKAGLRAWHVGHLEPGKSRTLKMKAVATDRGTLRHCTQVSYEPTLCFKAKVVEPELKVERIAPAQVLACEEVEMTYRISNVGTGTARNIKITERLPVGQITDKGSRDVKFTVEALPAGETEEFTVTTTVSEPGDYEGSVIVTDGVGEEIESRATTIRTIMPVLDLSVSAPDQAFTDNRLTTRIRITNVGEAEARDLVVRKMMPAHCEFTEASVGGEMEGEEVVWNLDPLAPGESVEIEGTVIPTEEGQAQIRVVADAYCADRVVETATTRFSGIPAILLEVVDKNDPVQVGDNEAYEITVTNQGNTDDTNVRVTVRLPHGMDLVTASGDARTSLFGRDLVFHIARLAPNDSRQLSVIAKAREAGGTHIEVTLESDNIDEPVLETEATTLY